MNNLSSLGFCELTNDELMYIDGGDGFWSDVWEGVKSFFQGVADGFQAVSLPM